MEKDDDAIRFSERINSEEGITSEVSVVEPISWVLQIYRRGRGLSAATFHSYLLRHLTDDRFSHED